MNQLTAFQRDILYTVGKLDDPHGLAIKDELEAYYNSEVNHGRLYPNLDKLADQGFLSKGQKDDRTNEYQLTEQAHDAIQQRREWEDIGSY
ncbi:MAG: PadR family transcriptional regulator [Woeseiaceae bacterium]|nr:PadR family transcriptional regulator [Woeseiaceae bacterium]